MPIKHMEEYRDPKISPKIVDSIKKLSRKKVRLMEVCGIHTMAIFQSGIRALLPETITFLSGPGCPVCVTAQKEIDAFRDGSLIRDMQSSYLWVMMTVFGPDEPLFVRGRTCNAES